MSKGYHASKTQPTGERQGFRDPFLQRMSPFLMLWTAPPRARECQRSRCLARAHRDQSEIFIQRIFQPATLPARGYRKGCRGSGQSRITELTTGVVLHFWALERTSEVGPLRQILQRKRISAFGGRAAVTQTPHDCRSFFSDMRGTSSP